MGLRNCPHFSDPEQDETTADETGGALPWSGLALGSTDLPAVAALSQVRLVAMVGLPKAGKTTALAASLLACRRGAGDYGERFAGSYTLAGWHQIARGLQWIPHGTAFPAHTTLADSRTPALLHLRLKRNGHSPLTDALYTDVPGEWFRSWAFDANAHKGAQWIAAHADAFILFADSDALAGEDRGLARTEYDALARRLASTASGRPIIPFLTKADIEIPGPIRAYIDRLNQSLFDQATRAISVSPGAGEPVTAAVDAGTAAALTSPVPEPPPEIRQTDFFMAYRSARAFGAHK